MGLLSKLKGHDAKADEADEEAKQAASSSNLAPPPAYASDDARSSVSTDAPEYLRPRFHQEGSAMAVMPPAFNVYASWKSTSKNWIGLTAEDKRFLIHHQWSFSSKKPPIVVHNGLSLDDPLLVQVGSPRWKMSQECIITVPSRPDRPGPPAEVKAGHRSQSWREWNYTFTMPISLPGAKEPQEHTFQWRSTTGEEVKLLDGGSRWSSGWKLIWATGPESGNGLGFGGDGREVVAVAARSSKSATKLIRFVYMGTGLTGTLGGDWELVCAASILQLHTQEQNSAGVATAVAVS